MLRKTLFLAVAALLLALATSSEAKAWYAYRAGGYRGGYGGGYAGYHYGGYHYGVSGGGYHYGYARRW